MAKKDSGILGKEIRAINVGIQSFADDLESQGVKVERVEWRPPAGGDEAMLRILEKLGS